jgi:hypothetical protein
MQKKLWICLVLFAVIYASWIFSQSTQSAPSPTNDQYLDEIRQRIAGHEDDPAETVFKNIELLRGKKASRLPGMMKALTGLLGVDCGYCHIPGHWESDDKQAKATARKHFAMQAALNQNYFNNENKISCWTCHRGKPQAELVPSDTK